MDLETTSEAAAPRRSYPSLLRTGVLAGSVPTVASFRFQRRRGCPDRWIVRTDSAALMALTPLLCEEIEGERCSRQAAVHTTFRFWPQMFLRLREPYATVLRQARCPDACAAMV